LKRILVIRGGALGDFIVTLPALKLLREEWPEAHLEVLGYPRIASLALNRYYLNAVRSVDYGPLSGFFIPEGVLDPDLMDYFSEFDLIVSYFYDPDGIFRNNLQRCGGGQLLSWAPQVSAKPAAAHFCAPLIPLGLVPEGFESRLFPSEEDRAFAESFVGDGPPLVAVHPGSGSAAKNWPVERWMEWGRRFFGTGIRPLLIGGEADHAAMARLETEWKSFGILPARELPLPRLAAVLEKARLLVGHDSGISHLAAAVKTPVIALFGPSDETVWAPPGQHVQVVRGGETLADISVEAVEHACRRFF
jgi:heptosyltransferase-3